MRVNKSADFDSMSGIAILQFDCAIVTVMYGVCSYSQWYYNNSIIEPTYYIYILSMILLGWCDLLKLQNQLHYIISNLTKIKHTKINFSRTTLFCTPISRVPRFTGPFSNLKLFDVRPRLSDEYNQINVHHYLPSNFNPRGPINRGSIVHIKALNVFSFIIYWMRHVIVLKLYFLISTVYIYDWVTLV